MPPGGSASIRCSWRRGSGRFAPAARPRTWGGRPRSLPAAPAGPERSGRSRAGRQQRRSSAPGAARSPPAGRARPFVCAARPPPGPAPSRRGSRPQPYLLRPWARGQAGRRAPQPAVPARSRRPPRPAHGRFPTSGGGPSGPAAPAFPPPRLRSSRPRGLLLSEPRQPRPFRPEALRCASVCPPHRQPFRPHSAPGSFAGQVTRKSVKGSTCEEREPLFFFFFSYFFFSRLKGKLSIVIMDAAGS